MEKEETLSIANSSRESIYRNCRLNIIKMIIDSVLHKLNSYTTKLSKINYNRITKYISKSTTENSLWNAKLLFRMSYAG